MTSFEIALKWRLLFVVTNNYKKKGSLESFIAFDIIVVVFHLVHTMSNWRDFSESQDEESQSEREFKVFLLQLPDQPQLS